MHYLNTVVNLAYVHIRKRTSHALLIEALDIASLSYLLGEEELLLLSNLLDGEDLRPQVKIILR